MLTDILTGTSVSPIDRVKDYLLNDMKWNTRSNTSLCVEIFAFVNQKIDCPSLKVITLPMSDPKYIEIKQMIEKTLKKKFTVRSIDSIINDYLYAFYLLRKQEYFIIHSLKNVTEELWFHGTLPKNIRHISLDNFDWRLNGSENGCSYGKGVYFSPSANYSSWYCGNNKKMVIVLASVLRSAVCQGDAAMAIPHYQNESKKVRFDTSANNNVAFVKYNDDEFHPQYIVHFLSWPVARRNLKTIRHGGPAKDEGKPVEDRSSTSTEKILGDPVTNEDQALTTIIEKFATFNALQEQTRNKSEMSIDQTDTSLAVIGNEKMENDSSLAAANQNKTTSLTDAKKKKRFFRYHKKTPSVIDSNRIKAQTSNKSEMSIDRTATSVAVIGNEKIENASNLVAANQNKTISLTDAKKKKRFFHYHKKTPCIIDSNKIIVNG